jgi:hypothetical protein
LKKNKINDTLEIEEILDLEGDHELETVEINVNEDE